MRLRHIEVFYAIYRCGSISAAARELNVSQPSVSKVLRHAEDQLGYLLFTRTKGRLVPTPAAHELFVDVGEIYSRVRSLSRTASNIGKRKGGHVRLGVLPSLGLSVLPNAIARFRKQEPEVTFEITTLHSRDVTRILFERECDVAVGYGAPPGMRLVTQQLGMGEMVLAARRDTFETDGEQLDLSVLDNVDFIGLRDSGPSGDLLMDELTARGIFPREVVTARTYYIAMSLAVLGVGITVSDIFTASFLQDEAIRYYRFAPRVRYPVNAITLEDHLQTDLLTEFLDTLRTVIREHEEPVLNCNMR
jgi:DNA-binding transcriptional LysR family regulator